MQVEQSNVAILVLEPVSTCIDTRWEKIYSNYYNTVFKKKIKCSDSLT